MKPPMTQPIVRDYAVDRDADDHDLHKPDKYLKENDGKVRRRLLPTGAM